MGTFDEFCWPNSSLVNPGYVTDTLWAEAEETEDNVSVITVYDWW
jgi:hypothetical protein